MNKNLTKKNLFEPNSSKHSKTQFSVLLLGQAHSSVERAGLLGGVRLRSVPADEDNQMRGEILEQFIREDLDKGFIPFYVSVFVVFSFRNETKPLILLSFEKKI